jgi:hypothetical protein
MRVNMPQDRDTGAAGNTYGRDCGEMIAKLLGATKVKTGRSSNECHLNGKRVVIKCSRSKKPQQVGVYCEMFERIDAVIGAFENPDGSYHVYQLPLESFKEKMRFREYTNGDRGLVTRAAFEEAGKLLEKIPASGSPTK